MSYREFTLLHENSPPNSSDPSQQKIRWKSFTNQWKQAADKNSCWVIGDLNLDMMKWNDTNYEHKELVDILKDNIETKNFSQVITQPTRFWNGSQSLIDHIWTNCPSKIMKVRNIDRAVADHNIITTRIRIKGQEHVPTETISRDKSNFDKTTFKNEVSKIDWTTLTEQKGHKSSLQHFL